MQNSFIKFDFLEFARDFLFVEDFDFYPSEIWEELEEALYSFFSDDEINVLNYRYGDVDFCSFSLDERRQILSNLVVRFTASRFYSEMDETMKSCESAIFSYDDETTYSAKLPNASELAKNSLAKIGLPYEPGTVGKCSFDSKIGDFPVYVWRSSDVKMPQSVLLSLLNEASVVGFERFFIVARARLTFQLPERIAGCIPYSFIPLIDETRENDGTDRNDQPHSI